MHMAGSPNCLSACPCCQGAQNSDRRRDCACKWMSLRKRLPAESWRASSDAIVDALWQTLCTAQHAKRLIPNVTQGKHAPTTIPLEKKTLDEEYAVEKKARALQP